jgi:hypothetical protein
MIHLRIDMQGRKASEAVSHGVNVADIVEF